MASNLCTVCLVQPSFSYDHYGSKEVCSSCRNFFRRSVQTRQFQDFECLKMSKIDPSLACCIDSRTRRSCKKCRFEKCLAAGMNPVWVSDQGSQKRALSAHNGKVASGYPMLARCNGGPVMDFTNEELLLVKHLEEVFNHTSYLQYFSLFSDDAETLAYFVGIYLDGKVLPFDLIRKMELIDLIVVTEIGLKLLSLENLTSFEQSVLIQANAPKVSAFLWAIFGALDEDLRFFQRLVDFGTENKHLTEVQQVLPAIQNLDLNRNVATESCYCAIYSSPWAAHADVEDEHFNITKSIFKWLKTPNERQADFLQLVLINMMILLSTEDLPHLDQDKRSRIEAVQLKYTLLFQRYLKFAIPQDAAAKFLGGLMLIQQSGQLSQLTCQRLPI